MSRMIGFIGAGNMAAAMIGGIRKAELFRPEEIIASNPSEGKLEALSEKYGIRTTTDNRLAAGAAELLFLCVKPQFMEAVLAEIRDVIPKETVIVSIAAGKSLSWLEEQLDAGRKLMRVMPNTPALCGAGMSAVCRNARMEKEEASSEEVLEICRSFGEAVLVPERLIDIAGQVAGASPAWLFMVLEALSDGAVHCGMPRELAYRFAAQGMLGAGKLFLESGLSPGALKDMVTSPGGTTIEGVHALEESGVRAAFMNAVIRANERAKKL